MGERTPLQNHIRRNAYIKLVPLFLAAVFGAVLSEVNGRIREGDIGDKLLALAGVILFLLASVAFLQTLTHSLTQLLSAHPARRLNKGRSGAIRFMMRLVGYVGITLITLELVGMSIGNLLIGGAALGVILGVAAQQALANFFASIVLIISHPYSIGDRLLLKSGAMGGDFQGVINDIGLIHTRIALEKSGEIVLLPNSQILGGTSIRLLAPAKPKT